MKILSANQIKDIDKRTLEYLKIESIKLMEMAVNTIFQWLVDKHMKQNLPVTIFCGVGNNGGDGVALACKLHDIGINVKVYIVEYSNNHSPNFEYYFNKAKSKGVNIDIITNTNQLPSLKGSKIIIDAIFGIGINREITGLPYQVIERINNSDIYTISIDMPSGMLMDRVTTFAIEANETVTLQIPKLSLYLPDNYKYAGDVTLLDFGLSKRAINEADTNNFYITKEDIKNTLKPLSKFSHKGTQGHSLIIGGSIGKIGSVCLASKGALKSGCGLVTAFVPKCGMIPLQSNFPEAMVIEDKSQTNISDIKYDIIPNAIGIGVGMGKSDETQKALLNFLKKNTTPLVIDADAINIIAENKEYIGYLSPNTILTPHPKELSRLIGNWNNDFDKIEQTKIFAKQHQLIIVIKGAYTLIVTSIGNVYVNSSGTSALSTAGSGDVLTGIITGLLAQGYTPLIATKIGVYLHGYTANIASSYIHPLSFVASDIIDNIGSAYFDIEKIIDDTEIEYNRYD